MDTDHQEVLLHESLNRPLLVLGGERNLVLMLGVVAGVFMFSLAQVWAFVTGVALWVGGQWALALAAKYDPLLSKVGPRHVRYRRVYPAAASPFAPDREVS
ncbi:MAG: conjugal transfer protein TrbD [Acidiferrobacteraceae bacterium]